MDYILIIILFLILIYLLNCKKRDNIVENFLDGNFNICRPDDCGCLNLNRAPDGKCVKYKIADKPTPPEYENKKYGKPYVVRNNLYPKKRDSDILIFVGYKMRNKKKNYENLPRLLQSLQKVEYGIYSEDESCDHIYDVFDSCTTICDYFKVKDNKPYLKVLILDVLNISKDRQVLGAYKIDIEDYPAVYLYNERRNELKKFKFDIRENRCVILENLLIFIADGDCGFISYINHLQDPFLGSKFIHDSNNNVWKEAKKGYTMLKNNFGMCKLIDYQNLPNNFKCKKHSY